MAYDAFISYSHGGDAVLAQALERGLERLARPWYRLRALSVFRDESDLALTPRLWSTIVTTLAESRFLVLLASPESAASQWVNKEVVHWCDTRGTDQLLVVVTGGEIGWDDEAGDFTTGSTAVPPALRGQFAEEPLYYDLRWARDAPELTLRLSRFKAAVAQVAATIRGMAPDDLEGEDVRLHRRARRLARAAVLSVVVLGLAAAVAAVVAVSNAHRADRRAREAIARQVGLQALDEPASALDRALLLSLAAAGLDSGAGAERFRSSRMLIGRYSRLDTILAAPTPPGALTSVRGLAFAADGRGLAAAALTYGASGLPGGALLRWDLESRGEPVRSSAPASAISFVGASGDVAVGQPGELLTIVRADGSDGAGALSDTSRIRAMRPGGGRAIVEDGGQLVLVDLTDGRRLAAYPTGTAAPVLTDTAALFPVESELAVVDVATGEERARVPGAPAGTIVAAAAGGALVTLAPSPNGEPLLTMQRWNLTSTGLAPAGGAVVAAVRGDETVATTPTSLAPTGAVLSADGSSLLLVDEDGTTIVDPSTGAVRARDDGATGVMAVDPTGRFVAMGGARFAVWDLTTAQRVIALPEPVNAIAWGGSCSVATGCRVATVGRSLDVWDALVLRHIRIAEETNAQAVAISPDGTTVASAGWGPSVSVWRLQPLTDDAGRTEVARAGGPSAYDLGTGTMARVSEEGLAVSGPEAPEAPLSIGTADGVELLAGATRALTLGPEGPRLWDLRGAAPVDLDPLCTGQLIATSPDRTLIASFRTEDRAVAVCDATSGRRVAASRLDEAIDPVTALAVADDGDVAVGGGVGMVARYAVDGDRLGSGTAIDVRFGGEPVSVTALALGESRLAAGLDPGRGDGAAMGRALVWDVGAGGEPIAFEIDQRQVVAVALLGEGDALLAVAGRDEPTGAVTVQVSEAATRRRLGRALGGLTGDVTFLGGTDAEVVGIDATGQAFRWSVDRDARRDICAIVGRPLARDEWDAAADGALDAGDFEPQCAGP